MTRGELRASSTLASIFALRMLGLFLILPVFAVHARDLAGGDNAMLVGLALGIYGLTQGVLQIPVGAASDRFGRKPVIIAGLLVFAAGSFIAAAATDVGWTIVGRAIQGAGAISAAVTAFVADATRDSQRTKAMAMVGGSIGLAFAISLVGAPLLYAVIGMTGLFVLTGLSALAAVAVVAWVVPSVQEAAAEVQRAAQAEAAALAHAGVPGAAERRVEPQTMTDEGAALAAAAAQGEGAPPAATLATGAAKAGATTSSLTAAGRPLRKRDIVFDADLLRLNFGIFVLHTVQMAMFVVVPSWLVESAGLPLPEHWKVYLPVVLVSFALMMPPLNAAERRGALRSLFAVSVALLAVVQALLALHPTGLVALAALLLVFFVVFNVLEAALPSLVSRIAPPQSKGLALGVYNTTQSLGLFFGGALGGLVAQRFGGQAVFVVTAVLCGLWLLAAPGLRRWPAARASHAH